MFATLYSANVTREDQTPASVLIVDDDAAVGKVLAAILNQAGLESLFVASPMEALAILERRPFDVVISDVRMPGMDGLELLTEIRRRHDNVPVILLTAHATISLAVEGMRLGAADFVQKPFDRDEVLFAIKKACLAGRAEKTPARDVDAEMIGESDAMREVSATIKKAARGTATVLVRGETGTGKELVARAIHAASGRTGAFVKVNCAALPEALLESELFGHEKGAFTGAIARKPGRVELAERGTLLLDEIGDITPLVQVKLLRVLQEREIERVGGTSTIRVDVRFIAATHRPLEKMVAEGTFREDLFYRLNVVPIRIPPLRERKNEIAPLARHFAEAAAKANGREAIEIERGAIEKLAAHGWPGNVRQLENFIERLVVFSDDGKIRERDVDHELGAPNASPIVAAISDRLSSDNGDSLDAHRKDAEKIALQNALTRSNNNRTLAARLLDVSRRTFYNKLKEHGLE